LRVEYPGAIYHVMSRADGSKGRILLSDVDGQDFLRSLAGPRGCGLAYRQVNRLHESKGYSRTARRAGGKAERIIGERLKGPGRREADLSQQPKSDPVKV
jgi:hypothetical protein